MKRPTKKDRPEKRDIMMHVRVYWWEREHFWRACHKAGLDESSGLREAMVLFNQKYGLSETEQRPQSGRGMINGHRAAICESPAAMAS